MKKVYDVYDSKGRFVDTYDYYFNARLRADDCMGYIKVIYMFSEFKRRTKRIMKWIGKNKFTEVREIEKRNR